MPVGLLGVAQVDYVDTVVGYLGHKVVLLKARHVRHVAPLAVHQCAGSAAHHVGVDVHGIDRIGHAEVVVPAHQLAYVARVALGAVVDEYLRRVDVYPARQKVVLHYRLAQEHVALLRAVAVESLLGGHVVHGLVHGLDHRRAERLGYVADTEADDVALRV